MNCLENGERRRSPKVLTLDTTVFILYIYFRAWFLCTGFPLAAMISYILFSILFSPPFMLDHKHFSLFLSSSRFSLSNDYKEFS